MNPREHFEQLLDCCVSSGASDLHLTSGQLPSLRVDGVLKPQESGVVSASEVMAMAEAVMNDRQRGEFAERHTVDIGYTSATSGERFRVNIYQEMGEPAFAVRHLDQTMFSFKELMLPKSLQKLAYLKSGLVLVTGVTGSGKSTTLAALIDEINSNRQCHVLTVEDPVEFVHESKSSLVHHREVHSDVVSYADAVRSAMREDPDVLMVGEMRDLETMQAAIIAAETGHLVFSTLHTGEAVGAIERFIGYFGGEEQGVARHRISMVLRAVIAQRLVPHRSGKGRVPVQEMLVINTAASNLIRTSKTSQLYSMMESGSKDGMWTLDQDLAGLVKTRKITHKTAERLCKDPEAFDKLVAVAEGDRR